jgi:hypothetical protein
MQVKRIVGHVLLAAGLWMGCGGIEPREEPPAELATREDELPACGNEYEITYYAEPEHLTWVGAIVCTCGSSGSQGFGGRSPYFVREDGPVCPPPEPPERTAPQDVPAEEQALASLTAGVSFCTNMGNGFYGCTGGAQGGTPPYTFSWTSNTAVTIGHVATGPTNTRIEGTCRISTIGNPNQVTLTVQDSVGATASAQRNFRCTTIVP